MTARRTCRVRLSWRSGSLAAVPRIAESFRTGAGMGWHEHQDGVFHGCEKFFRPGYAANLVSSWIPSLSDVRQKLEAGARVADVGCGKGASTLLMAKAFPKSQFFGFDYHDKSIEAARESAKRQGIAERVSFEVAKAKDFPGKDYDFVAVFDCLHDMGDPVGAAAHVRQLPGKRRHLDDCRALCQRSTERQSESRGTGLLLVLHPAVHSLLEIAGSGALPGRAGGGEADSRGCHFGRLQPLSPSD